MGKFLSFVCIVAGVGLFLFGNNLSKQASLGEEKLNSAEAQVQNRRQPLVGPVRKGANARATESAQEKINQQQPNVISAKVSANWLQGSGVVLFLLGSGNLALRSFRSKKK